ncbi:MAG: hypothetical protein L3K17_00380 [Thermoplasmata archaeon]|nr:hypothetical protein [Thermoplasmata archaeon]
MTRTAGSGAYLGGISTMLMQVDVCPSCGHSHQDSRLGSLLPRTRECPLVVFGSIPTVTEGHASRPKPQPFTVELIGDSEPMLPPLPQPTAVSASPRKPSGLAVPWPMPSHLEDYL